MREPEAEAGGVVVETQPDEDDGEGDGHGDLRIDTRQQHHPVEHAAGPRLPRREPGGRHREDQRRRDARKRDAGAQRGRTGHLDR